MPLYFGNKRYFNSSSLRKTGDNTQPVSVLKKKPKKQKKGKKGKRKKDAKKKFKGKKGKYIKKDLTSQTLKDLLIALSGGGVGRPKLSTDQKLDKLIQGGKVNRKRGGNLGPAPRGQGQGWGATSKGLSEAQIKKIVEDTLAGSSSTQVLQNRQIQILQDKLATQSVLSGPSVKQVKIDLQKKLLQQQQILKGKGIPINSPDELSRGSVKIYNDLVNEVIDFDTAEDSLLSLLVGLNPSVRRELGQEAQPLQQVIRNIIKIY